MKILAVVAAVILLLILLADYDREDDFVQQWNKNHDVSIVEVMVLMV